MSPTPTYAHTTRRLNTRKFKTGLAKLGSIRRNAGRPPPKTRPTISDPQPIKLEIDSTDGVPPLSSGESGSLVTNVSDSPVGQLDPPLPAVGEGLANFHRQSRRAIMSNYHQDTVSLDSVSVSSQSEVSEGMLTASGERCLLADDHCYLPNETRPDLLFNVGSNGVHPAPKEGGDTSLEDTLRSPEADKPASIRIEIGTGSSRVFVPVDEDDYDHLEETDVLQLLTNDVSPTHRTNRLVSVDFEKTPSIDRTDLLSTITSQDLWKNSIIQLESDSDSESTNKEGLMTKLTNGDSAEESLTQSLPDSVYSAPAMDSSPQKERPDEANYYNFSVLVSEMHYANVFIPGPGGNAYGQSSAPVKRSRPRSKSSSPYSSKKPVPLPRRGTVASNGHATGESPADEKREFVESLPANFKPQPPPKPASLAGFSPKVSCVFIHTPAHIQHVCVASDVVFPN